MTVIKALMKCNTNVFKVALWSIKTCCKDMANATEFPWLLPLSSNAVRVAKGLGLFKKVWVSEGHS